MVAFRVVRATPGFPTRCPGVVHLCGDFRVLGILSERQGGSNRICVSAHGKESIGVTVVGGGALRFGRTPLWG